MELSCCFTAVSVLLALSLVRNCFAECRFEYTQQPPSTIADCNPYQSTGQDHNIVISLECTVSRQNGITDQYDVRWFRENAAGTVEDLGQGSPAFRTGGNELLASTYHDTAFFNQRYNASFLGMYWCQVINTTADPDQPLMRSNVFTLLAPENYTGSTCSGASQRQTVANTTCADLPAPSVQTTLPVPATTTDTSVTQQMTTSIILIQQSPASSFISMQQSPGSISLQQAPSSISIQLSPTISDTPAHQQSQILLLTYVVVATVLVVLVVSVTVITMVTVLVYKRCSRKQKTGQAISSIKKDKNMEMVQIEKVESEKKIPSEENQVEEPPYSNLHYLHHHPTYPPTSQDYDEVEEPSNKPAHYQPLHTDTRDYTSMYTAAGRKGAPSVEVEGNLYSIVDPTRREEHTYSTPQQ